jgi:lipid II:glycine glycyltransferase (peptidoglycan interpeptide bridge formation enzyme)
MADRKPDISALPRGKRLLRPVEIADPQAWDRALLALPDPHVLQSWAWGEFKSRHGWSATRLLFEEGSRTVAAASILKRRLPRLPMSILYVPKGPALDWTDAGLAGRVLAELERLARQQRALLVKIDPDLYYPGLTPLPSSRPACALDTARLLTAQGWRFSDEQIQFRNTLLLDLTRSEEELLAAMKQKTRYNVRLAARRGVRVRPGSGADLDLFYRLYAETAQRDGFIIRPPDYYRDAWGRFMDEGPGRAAAHLLLAEAEGEVVAGLILFLFGPTAWYMYGASSDRHRELMPNHLLQWEAIRLARSLGCILYDLWGAPERLDESDPMWGVVHFKQGLGGELARGLGAWDHPANRLGYRLYAAVMPHYLEWRRGRHEQPAI